MLVGFLVLLDHTLLDSQLEVVAHELLQQGRLGLLGIYQIEQCFVLVVELLMLGVGEYQMQLGRFGKSF